MANNDIYNKSGSSLQDAYTKLAEARQKAKEINNTKVGVVGNTTAPSSASSDSTQDSQYVGATWFERVLGTIDEARNNIESTFLNIGEGVVDAHLAIGGIFDQEWAEKAIKFDVSDKIMQWRNDNFSANALYKKQTGKNLYDQSYLNEASDKVKEVVTGIESGIGSALAFMSLSNVPYAGVALTTMGAGGSTMEEALNSPEYNGNYFGAWGYSAISGGIETVLEYALGWNPKKAGISTKGISNILKKIGKNFAEEGLEEVASELATPLFEGMYTDKTIAESYDDVTLESIATTFVIGGFTGAIMTGAGEIATSIYLSSEGKAISLEIQENEQKYIEAYEKFKKNPNEAQAYNKFVEVRDKVVSNMKKLGERVAKLSAKYQQRAGRSIIIDGKKVNIPLTQDYVNEVAEIKQTEDPRIMAAEETIKMINLSSVKSIQDLQVEFVSENSEQYKEIFGNKKNANGMIDKKNKKIYLNINSKKAIRFVLGHELSHALEENEGYDDIKKEIIKTLEDENKYEELFKELSERYKTNDVEDIEQEMIADYLGNTFESFDELQSLFRKKSTWEKFKEMVKNVRNKNGSSKIKKLYQEMLKKDQQKPFNEKELVRASLDSNDNTLDSNGNTLSKDQQEFFKDSKVRDEDGNLMVMYHGTTQGGFSIFDSSKKGYTSKNVVYFTNSLNLAKHYSNNDETKFTNEEIEKTQQLEKNKEKIYNEFYKINNTNNMVDFINKNFDTILEANFKNYNYKLEAKLENDKVTLTFYKENKVLSNKSYTKNNFVRDFKETYSHYVDRFKENYLKGVYEVYLNIKKPLIVDCKGQKWYDIKLTQNDINDKDVFEKSKGHISTDGLVEEINKNFKQYDGVIFKNIIDGGNNISNVYVTLRFSNQIKLTSNKNPTENKDIRYSLSETTEEVALKISLSRNSNITFEDTYGASLKALSAVSRYKPSEKSKFDSNIKALTTELVDAMRIDGKTIQEYFGLTKEEAKAVKKMLRDDIANTIIKDSSKLSKQNKDIIVERMIARLIKNFETQVKTMTNLKNRGMKSVSRIASTKFWAKTAIDQKAMYAKNKLEGSFKSAAEFISKIKFTDKTTKVNSSYIEVVGELNKFYKLEAVDNFKNKDMGVQLYVEEAFKYFDERVSKGNNKPLDTDSVINDQTNYSLISGKTEMEVFADILTEMRRIINASKKIVYAELGGEQVIAKEEAKNELEKQKSFDRKTARNAIFKGASRYMLSLIDVKAYMTIMAHAENNSLMYKLYEQLVSGQRKTYEIRMELLKDLEKISKDKEGKKLIKSLKQKKYNIKFRGVELSRGEAIGLYMMMKTDNAWSHLIGDGVEFETKILKERRRLGKNDFLSFQSDDVKAEIEMIQSIKNTNLRKETLSKEQQEYLNKSLNAKNKSTADLNGRLEELYKDTINRAREALKKQIGSEYDGLISTLEKMYAKSGEYYVEAAQKMLGFAFSPKDYYYPTKGAKAELSDIDALTSYVSGTLNPSFSKKLISNAKNALYVGDVMDTAFSFVKTLSTYCGVTVEIKNINKFLNAEIRTKGEGVDTLNKYFNDYVDPRFVDRMDGLFKSMQGIKTKKDNFFDKAVRWIRKQATKVALGANLKTAFTQLTSYVRGWLYISDKSMWAAMRSKKSLLNKGLYDFKKLLELSPYAANRYFDNNVYKIEALGALDNVDNFTNILMKPIEIGDKLPIVKIWYACQLETMENGKVNLDKAVALFEKVLLETQAQQDDLGNGSITRIDNEVLKGTLMYTSETRKLFSRLFESWYKLSVTKKGTPEYNEAKKMAAKSTTLVVANAVMMTAIAWFAKFLRGDYDDKEKEEIASDILVSEFAGNFVGFFPILKDIYNTIVNDYDLQLGGFTHFIDSLDIFTEHFPALSKKGATEGEIRSALLQILTKVGHLFGIPIRNMFNDLLYFAGASDKIAGTDLVMKMKNFYYNTSNSSLSVLLNAYVTKKDEDKVSAVIQAKFKNYISGSIEDKQANELARLYINGSIKKLPNSFTNSFTYNGETIELSKSQAKQAKDIYSIANELFEEMLRSSYYKTLTDMEKAVAIRKLFDTYYNLAKASVIEGYELNKFEELADYIDITKYSMYLGKISQIEQTEEFSRKAQVNSYINSLRMSAKEKYLVKYLAGYSLSEEHTKQAKAFLRNQGMNSKAVDEYFS